MFISILKLNNITYLCTYEKLRSPQKFETIFHFVLTLLSNVKKCGRVFQILWPSLNTHWDFLPKFLSLHYYTTLEGVLGVQRSGQAQGTIICLLGPLFFSQNGMTFKKPTKIIKIQWKITVFWDIFRVCSILAGKQQPKPIWWT